MNTIVTKEWVTAESLAILKRNFKFWAFDPCNWLRSNMPTLARYLR